MTKKEGIVVYLGTDHAGFSCKEKIKAFLEKKKIEVKDCGAYAEKSDDDYPEYAFTVAMHVAKNAQGRGILVCGSGVGMAIAANKVSGIRAVAAETTYAAKMSRLHNDTNVLALSSRNTSLKTIQKIIDLWLTTQFSRESRHVRRIQKISNFERK